MSNIKQLLEQAIAEHNKEPVATRARRMYKVIKQALKQLEKPNTNLTQNSMKLVQEPMEFVAECQQVIKMGKASYEAMRCIEANVSGNEQLLFESCFKLQQACEIITKLSSKKHITLTQAREMALFQAERSRERQKWADTQEENKQLQQQLSEEREAAKKLCKIYFDIAAEVIGEEAVREKREQALS